MTLLPVRTLETLENRLARDAGSVTAEYAVATVAACGFAGVLYKILTSPQVLDIVVGLFTKALSLIF